MSHHRRTITALVLGLLAAGCGDDPTPAVGGPDPDAAWRTSTDPVDPAGFVWLVGTTVHLDDGSTIELTEPTETYVVAGDGVFSLVDADEGSTVLFTALGKESVDTGLDLVPESLRASTDGRYLVGVDLSLSDEQDQYGTSMATTLVLDLETGEEVVRSTEGMGDTGADSDLASLYSETEIGDTAFVDDAAWVRTADGILAFDLATGETAPVDDLMPDAPADDPTPTGADGRWTVLDRPGLTDTLVSEGGETVVPDTGTDRWTWERWLDDTRIVGAAVDGPGGDEVTAADRTTLMTCEVPSGACDVLEDTTGQAVYYPAWTTGTGGIFLQDGGTR